MMDTVVVPLDGQPGALAALPVARRIAALKRARVRILHVAEEKLAPLDAIARVALSPAQALGLIVEVETGPTVQRIVVQGSAGLLVMTTYSQGDKPTAGLGPICDAVVRGAQRPLLLVPPECHPSTWRLQRILLPLDGTPTSMAAVRPAAELGWEADADLLVVHLTSPPNREREPGTLRVPEYIDQPQHAWGEWASEFVERLACLCHLPPRTTLRLLSSTEGRGRAIIEAAIAERIDLIVLSRHSPLPRTVATVLRDSPVPVLLLAPSQ